MKRKLFFMTILLAMFTFTIRVEAYEDFKLIDEIVEITNENPYQVQFDGNMESLEFELYDGNEIATIDETGILTPITDGKSGVVRLTVLCKDLNDNNCYQYLNNINTDAIIVINKDNKYDGVYTGLKDEYDAKKTELQAAVAPLTFTDVKVGFTKDFLTYSFETTNDKGEKDGVYKNYGKDFLFAGDELSERNLFLPDYTLSDGIDYSHYISGDNITTYFIFDEEYFRYEFEFVGEDGTKVPWGVNVTLPRISGPTKKIIYATENSADKKLVQDLLKTIPIINKSYLNVDVFSKFSVKSLIERQFNNSEAAKLIKDNKLDSYIDPRYGDSSPMSPFFGGYLVLGKNDVFYAAQELRVWSTLKLPKNASISTEQNIKEYFETYLDGDYTIRVEKDEEYPDVFRVYMKENKKLTFLDEFLSLFIPRVYADEESVITFAVEEVNLTDPKETNPPTGDNILLYSLIAGVSLIGFTGGTLYLKRRNKNRKVN